jgi:hypothetical protein
LNTQLIMAELEAERDRLDAAIAALQGHRSGGRGKANNGRRKGKRHLSAAAKKRIGEAKRKWWAEHKKR